MHMAVSDGACKGRMKGTNEPGPDPNTACSTLIIDHLTLAPREILKRRI